jgi:ATP-binding cassette subfamily C (CFTR/MRP) protein 1
VLKIAILILLLTQHSSLTLITYASLALVESIAICYLSYQEHQKAIRPSAVLNVYLLISLLCELMQLRACIYQDVRVFRSLTALYTAGIGIKTILMILESISKATILKEVYKHLSPESTAGIFSRLFFWWLNPLFFKGYKNILAVKDLPSLDDELSTTRVQIAMQQSWDARRMYTLDPATITYINAYAIQQPNYKAKRHFSSQYCDVFAGRY